jgi:hypothetical protein
LSSNLKLKICDYLLQKEIRKNKRKAEVITFEKAYDIGILYDATTDSDYELIKNYVRDLRAMTKDVVSLGYYDRKELPNTRFMKLGLDLFTKKALSWKMKPADPLVTNFVNRNFDILICLNLTGSIPLRYVSSMTKAKFKIGKYDPSSVNIYDLMIMVENNTSLKQMIEQTGHYLKQIRNEEHKKA